MITLKSKREIDLMRKAGRVNALAHQACRDQVKVGITTKELDQIAEEVIRSNGAIPTFKGLYGFPNAACISVNDCLIHGIPDDYILKEGDIVSIDLGSTLDGYVADSARTWPVGKISKEVEQLIEVTRNSFFEGMKVVKPDNRIGDLSYAIGSYVKQFGYGVPMDYTGHGVGKALHEDPAVPNDGIKGKGVRFREGMTFACEPMVTMGKAETYTDKNGWYTKTVDGLYSAHYENTVVVTSDGVEILTLLDGETY